MLGRSSRLSRRHATTPTRTAATSAGPAQFSVAQPRKNLSPEATREIASAVLGLVSKVPHKRYAPDSCMAFLTSSVDADRRLELREELGRVIDLCVRLVAKGIERALRVESTFDDSGVDPNIEPLTTTVEEASELAATNRIVAGGRWHQCRPKQSRPRQGLLLRPRAGH